MKQGSDNPQMTAVAWDDPRVVALARRLCRYKDSGGPCEGPGNDCDADNCRTVERAVKEVTHAN